MAQRVLVVDDESRMRKLVKDFLTRAGYQVLEAQDGEEAVDPFKKGPSEINQVFKVIVLFSQFVLVHRLQQVEAVWSEIELQGRCLCIV